MGVVANDKFSSVFAEWNSLELRKELRVSIWDSLGSEIGQVHRVYRARTA